ncbi:MAG TPA: hypothetical protein VFQ86_05910 [Arachidicoccus soli]|nr:hypothetical protein [Arachidicoccus soli]
MGFKDIVNNYDIDVGIMPVSSSVGIDYGDKGVRIKDLDLLIRDMRKIKCGRNLEGVKISAKDEVLAAGVILKANELIGRWQRYEESVVNNNQQNNTVINIIRG